MVANTEALFIRNSSLHPNNGEMDSIIEEVTSDHLTNSRYMMMKHQDKLMNLTHETSAISAQVSRTIIDHK